MNHENLRTLIETIKEADKKGLFDINHYSHPCGTPACIAGYAAELMQLGRRVMPDPWDGTCQFVDQWSEYNRSYNKALAKYLEIPLGDAIEIATGFKDDDCDRQNPTVEDAVEYLEAYAENPGLTWAKHFSRED